MASKKVIAIVSAAAGIVVVGAGLFGIYRHFVTPERVIALSVMNLHEAFDEAFDYIDDEDADIIKDYVKDGGKLALNMTLETDGPLGGMPVSLTANSDGRCTVTDIKLYDEMEFSVYKDDEQTLINTPLFGGGFSIDNDELAEKCRMAVYGMEYGGAYATSDSILAGFVTDRYSVSDYIAYGSEELKAAVAELDIRHTGHGNVMIGGSTKRASTYSVHVSSEAAKRFVSVLADYICMTDGVGETEHDEIMAAFGEIDVDMVFRVRGNMLREIFVAADGYDEYTVAFCGEGNPFDQIAVYKNGDTRNAVRRTLTGSGGKYSDEVKVGDTTVFTAEYGKDSVSARLDIEGTVITASAEGKTGTDESISFDKAELSVNDSFTLTGGLTLSEEYDEDFGFSKSGEYVDLLSISDEDWAAVSGTLVSALELLGKGE